MTTFTGPVGANNPGESLSRSLGAIETADKVSNRLLFFGRAFDGGLVAHLDELTGLGKISGFGIGGYRAGFSELRATVAAVGFRKRGAA